MRRTSRSARLARSRPSRNAHIGRPNPHLESLEERLLLAAMPLVTVPAQTSTLLGDTVNLNLVFDNVGDAAGYGPYIDLLVPIKGTDGKTSSPNDGIVDGSLKATYLGATLTPIVLTFDASGNVTHPLAKDSTGAPIIVSAPPGYGPGDELIVLVLPFGSFTVGQPPATIQITAQLSNLANVGTPLPIEARAGFEYGADPLDNPTVDPTIIQPTYSTGVINPVLFTVTKTYIGPENETATGPDYVRQYEIDVSVAKNQVLTSFALQDLLPGNIQFVSVDTATANTGFVTATITPSTTTPGGLLRETFNQITGTGGIDAKLVFSFYVPRDPNGLDGTTTPDLPSGGFTPTTNTATASGRWTPIDRRDPSTNVAATSNTVTVTEKSIAIQKSATDVEGNATNAVQVGDHILYTLNFQVSDFFAFSKLVATDLFSDGQHFDAAFTPQFTFTRAGVTHTITILPDAFLLSPQSTTDGSDLLTFDLSKALTEAGYSPLLLGGSIPNSGTGGAKPNAQPSFGATTGVITFQTVVQQKYDVQKANTNTQFLKQGDILGDKTTITGDVLNYRDLTDTGTTRTDNSAATVSLAAGQLTKTVYAINGVLYNSASPALIAAGDDVTYRLTYTLPHTNFDKLNIQDFLPLPIFLAGQLNGTGVGAYAGIPPAGTATYGPSDTSNAITRTAPTLTENSTANSLTFDFGNYHDVQQRPSTIDLLLTVTATGMPFADGLFLTNQAHEFEQSVDNSGVVGQVVNNSSVADTIVQVKLTEPVLNVKKGVVSTSDGAGKFSAAVGPAGVSFGGPGSGTAFAGTVSSAGLATTPIDSNLSNVQAGDKVRFAVTVENTGTGLHGAFDVTIKDTLPAGFDPASLSNLQVHNGAGTALVFTVLPGGLFGGGIRLTDPSATRGALGAYDPNNGANIAVITYDLTLDNTVTPSQNLVNVASLTDYASTPNGPDFLSAPLTDPATVTVAQPTIAKTLVSTSLNSASNSNTQAVIGEKATYTVTVTVPQGTSPSAAIADTLANGLAFVQLDSVTSNSGALTSSKGAFSNTSLFEPTILDAGAAHRLSFDFGTLSDSDTNPATPETLTITYEAVVLDVAANKAGTTLTNSADFTWKDAGNTSHQTAPVAAQNITVIEPKPTVTKVADNTSPQANDVVTYTIAIANTAAGSTDAYHLALSDPLPAGETLVGGSFKVVSNTSGSTPTLLEGATLSASFADFAFGGKTVLTYQVKIDQADQPGQSLANIADVQWTSLPTLTAITPNNPNAVPRGGPNSGIAGDTVHTYETTGTATIKIPVGLTKSLVSTSEGLTSLNNLTIGEIARYQLVVALPTSTSPNFQILDKLPQGLTFLNDGTATLAFVSGSAGGAYVAGTSPAGIYTSDASLQAPGYYVSSLGTPTQAIPAGVIFGGTGPLGAFKDGDQPVFSLGTLTNTENDGKTQYVVIDFNAVLDNSALGNNKAGDTRTNVFDVKVNGTQAGTDSNPVVVQVVEPKITNLIKTVSNGAHDAGDVVTYTVTYSNTGTATAYNVKLSDTLPASLVLDGASIAVTTTGTGIAKTATGNNLSVLIDQLDAGASVTITYQATLIAGVTAGQSITNGATLTYASLPGTNGTTPNPTGSTSGASGTDGGGRDGSGGNAMDIYNGATSVTFAVPTPTVDKHIISGNELGLALPSVVVGETLTYDLVVKLPEGVTKGLSVTDAMPAGLLYQSFTVITSAAASNSYFKNDYAGGALPVATHSVVGGKDVFTFGDTTDNFDNITNNDSFVIQVTALVTNVGTNVAGHTLQNTSSLTYTNGTTNNPTTIIGPTKPKVTVVAPNLTLSKTVSATTGDAGDPETVTLTLKNTGTGPAYDVIISDPLAVAKMLGASALSTPAGFAFAYDAGTNTVSYTATAGTSVAAGASLTFSFATALASAVVAGDTLTNTAKVTRAETTDTLPVGDPNNRDVSGATGTATVSILTPTVDKHFVSGNVPTGVPTNVAVGETVTYDLVVTLPEGVTKGLSVTDAMPAGLLYQSFTVITSAAASNGYLTKDYAGGTPSATPSAVGSNEVFTFGDTTNAFDNITTDDSFVIQVTALVTNVGTNVSGQTLTNTSSLTYTNGTTGNPTTIIGPTKPTVTVVEPKLNLVKTMTPAANLQAGDVVGYSLNLTNNGTSDAYDTTLSDAAPADLQITGIASVSGVAGVTAANFAIQSGGTGITTTTSFTVGVGETLVITYSAVVRPSVTPGESLTNNATATGTSTPGTNPNERTTTSSDSKTGTAATTFQLIKTVVGATTYAIGADVTYDLTLNVIDGTTPGVVVTDALPAGMVFVPGSVVVTHSAGMTTGYIDEATSFGIAGQNLTFHLGDLLNPSGPSTVTIRYTAQVADVAGNHAGDQPDNFATATTTAPGIAPSTGDAKIRLVEPALTVVKTLVTAGKDATDPVVYDVTITNAAGANVSTAYDVAVSDALDAALQLLSPSTDVIIQSNPGYVTIASNSSTAGQVNLILNQLNAGDSVTLRITAALKPGAQPATVVHNHVDVVYTSLPGTVPGERTGSGGVDDYSTSADASAFTVFSNSLSGKVFYDPNDNGIFDGTDAGIVGASVTLTGHDFLGNVVSTTVQTDSSGNYSFTGLRPSDATGYTITETQPAGYVDGKDAHPAAFTGTVGAGSSTGVQGNDVVSSIVIGRGSDLVGPNYTFGEVLPSSISGTAYRDDNDNGQIDAGEPHLGNVPVRLTGTDSQGNAVDITINTDGSGNYSFANLEPSDATGYTVTLGATPGLLDGIDTIGPVGGTTGLNAFTIVLPQNTDAPANNFGKLLPSSLAGTVYVDSNNDGVQDGTEAGIAGVTVTLTGTDDHGTIVPLTATTDGSGHYAFTALRPGTYTVTETQPVQYADGQDAVGSQGGTLGNDVLSNVPLSSGIAATSYDFGELPAGLSGKVFVDHNADGLIDGTDGGLGGVTLTLFDSNGVLVGTTTTLADGTYSFGNLPAGNYRVVETQPNGYGSSTATFQNVNVPTTGLSNVNFGETLASLAGTVYDDRDASGSLTVPDTGIGGVLVTLTGTDANGTGVSKTTTTNPDGSYFFTDLLGGTYTVSESQPAGYTSATNNAGTSGGTVTGDTISAVALGAAVNATGYDYGEVIPTAPGKTFVTGTVYVDANRDGTLEGGETGIGGVTLRLLDSTGKVVGTTTTNANGSYAFVGILPGAYTIDETQPLAYGSSTPNSLSVAVPPTGLANQNFGETTSTLGGTVYVDTNNNGVQDGGETGIGGVTVALTGTDVYGASVTKTLTTNPDGTYSFGGLLTGTYTVTEAQPPQYADGKDRVGTAGGTLGNDILSNVAITGGIDATHYDFGERPASLSGTVFVDHNADGIINGTDSGLGGVALTLIDANGKTVGTTTTNPDGTYSFGNLVAGNYQVVETQPVGYGSSTPNVLNVTVPTTGLSNVNYGETLSSLAGVVYLDANKSGGLDAGEPGIGGVTLTLTGTDATGANVTATTTTNTDGSYLFTGLLAGNYTVTETQPAGYGEGADKAGTGGGGTSTIDVISGIGVGSGVALTGYQFGEVAPTTPPGTTFLTGTVYHDTNADGLPNGGEAGIGGVTLQLLDGSNHVIASTTTNPDGTYSFTGFAPGSYTVHETQPAGYGSSTPNDLAVTVPAAGLTNQNFGETLGSLSGLVYLDRDLSGTLTAGDTPIGGVTVQLFDGNAFVTSTTTATDGTYRFDNLPAGTYSVREIQPAAYNEGGNNLGSLGGTATTDLLSSVVLDATSAASFNGTDYDFGETGSTLSGEVFLDRDRSGTITPGDANLGGVTVQLYDANNNLVGTATTLPDGTYSFGNLAAGNYRVVEVQPNGYGTSTPTVQAVTLPTAGLSNINFGDTLSTLAGTVYVDRDGSKSLTGADLRLQGVTITLTGTDANGKSLTLTTTTLADGTYSFGDLLAGNYTVTETQPAQWNDGTDTLGSVGGVLAPNTTTSIGLGQGVDGVSYDFGELGAAISGYAYYDKNRDAIYEPTETPLPNVTITLRDSTGNVVAVQRTGNDGSYSFANLPAGDYSIAETQPTGYGSSTPNVLNDTLPLTGLKDQNFGDTKTSLAGHVYLDQNKNGTRDRTEPGLAGVALTLTGTDANGQTVSAQTTTADDGSYSFDELLSGLYSIRETQPARYGEGRDTVGTSGGDGSVQDLFTNVALLPDMPGTGYDFGEVGTRLSGKVFIDGNLDGIAQPAEAGLGGVTIDLLEGGLRVASTTTNPDGTYAFDNLPTGPYRIVEHQPIAYGSSTPNTLDVTLPPTGKKDENFGETTGTLSGSVWIDRNNDGVREPGETGIPNTLITLTGTDVLGHAVSENVETDSQGGYSFTGLLKGNYQIARAGLPAGYVAGTNHLGSQGGSVTVDVFLTALPAGTSGLEYDFAAVPVSGLDPTLFRPQTPVVLAPSSNTLVPANGLVDPLFGFGPGPNGLAFGNPGATRDASLEEGAARLAGYVFHDRNSNDVPDENEEGIGGVGVTLSGVTAKGRTISRTTTTDDSGAYTFNDLPPGLYSVGRSTPEGFLDGGYLLGTVNGSTAGEISFDNFARIALQNGGSGLDYNFAEIQPAALRGVVWVSDAELEEDPGTFSVVGKAGVTVTLTGKDDRGRSVSRTTKSDAEGQYQFEGLYPGEYDVQVATPRGFRAVEAQPGTKGGTAQAKKQIDKIRLSPGDKGSEYEFYYEGTGQVAGRVAVRPGVVGRTVGMGDVVVVLTGTDREGRAVERTTTTDAKGHYLFYALPPGTYRVEVKAEPDEETWAKSPALVNGKPAGVPVEGAIAVEGIPLGADGRATGLDFTASGGAE